MIYNFFGTHDEDIEFDKQCLKLIVGDQVYILEEFEGNLWLLKIQGVQDGLGTF